MKDDKKLNKKTHKNTNDSTFIQGIRLYEGCRSDYNIKSDQITIQNRI